MLDIFQALYFRSLHLAPLIAIFFPDSVRRSRDLTGRCLIVVICSFIISIFSPSTTLYATPLEFKGKGELIVVSPSSSTAVIDLKEKNRQRIIGGKLAPDAILLKNDRKVDLNNFHVGEEVRVIWRLTERGKEILSILGFEDVSTQHEIIISQALSTQPQTSLQPAQTVKQPVTATEPIAPETTETDWMAPLPQTVLSETPIAPIIGKPLYHIVGPKETLLDIARSYDLGFNELADLYPDFDPWLPPVGKRLKLPTERILPKAAYDGIVVNVAELRLYHYISDKSQTVVRSFPVGIGNPSFQTPSGTFFVANKVVHPTWFIPPSLRPKYNIASVPPGPDNPLGQYWMGLKGTNFGIHGTDIAWSIGRTVTHGCIRMYPEDIERFYPTIALGSTVHITYEPVKITRIQDRVIIEVHKDIYAKLGNVSAYTQTMLQSMGLWNLVDHVKLTQTIHDQSGIPIDITSSDQSLLHTDTFPALPIRQSN